MQSERIFCIQLVSFAVVAFLIHQRSMIGEGYCNQFVSVCLSVCALFCPYSSKTMTSISLKFGGQVFYGVQTDSFKFGVICLKIKVRREFFLFLIGNTQ